MAFRAPSVAGSRGGPPPRIRRLARGLTLVNRDFAAEHPNELWVADFSYLRCWEGLVFFSFVIDVYSRKIVGWQFAGNMRTTLVLDALRMVLSTRERVQEVRLIHHSDGGSQYVSGDYTQTLQDHDVLASVGSTGDAYDKSCLDVYIGAERIGQLGPDVAEQLRPAMEAAAERDEDPWTHAFVSASSGAMPYVMEINLPEHDDDIR